MSDQATSRAPIHLAPGEGRHDANSHPEDDVFYEWFDEHPAGDATG